MASHPRSNLRRCLMCIAVAIPRHKTYPGIRQHVSSAYRSIKVTGLIKFCARVTPFLWQSDLDQTLTDDISLANSSAVGRSCSLDRYIYHKHCKLHRSLLPLSHRRFAKLKILCMPCRQLILHNTGFESAPSQRAYHENYILCIILSN